MIKRRSNKKGFQLAINTLVIIVLAMLILAVLSIAFTTGFGNFWKSVKGYFGSEIDNLNKICKSQCDMQNKFSFWLFFYFWLFNYWPSLLLANNYGQ